MERSFIEMLMAAILMLTHLPMDLLAMGGNQDRPVKGQVVKEKMIPQSKNTSLQHCENGLQHIAGTYQGHVTYQNKPNTDPVVSTFYLEKPCNMAGNYQVTEPGGTFSGNFANARQLDENTVQFSWHDKYGNGMMNAVFTEGNKTFTATWGKDNATSGGQWTGTRKSRPDTHESYDPWQ